VRIQNGTTTLESSLELSYKMSSDDLAVPLLDIYQVENLYPHENLFKNIYTSFIHNCQKLEATKIFSIDEWNNCGISRP
jgi:hypothetical protein